VEKTKHAFFPKHKGNRQTLNLNALLSLHVQSWMAFLNLPESPPHHIQARRCPLPILISLISFNAAVRVSIAIFLARLGS
jgi:hypothetical protein